jgi:hypothetical protein
MADTQFGRCVTPVSPPSKALLNTVNLPVTTKPAARFRPLVPYFSSSSSSNSSSDDEVVENKRLKLDPDYIPSTTSEGTLTATNSQDVSEEEDERKKEETETEDEEESWHPSRSTSPEVYSSPEDD